MAGAPADGGVEFTKLTNLLQLFSNKRMECAKNMVFGCSVRVIEEIFSNFAV